MKRFLTLIMASMCLLNVCAQQIDITSAEDFSPYVFGHNLEHTRAAVNGGLSAQMLKNRKFAGKPSRNRGVAAHWTGIGEKVLFMMDSQNRYTKHIGQENMHRGNELNAQIVANLTEGQQAGIAQKDLALNSGKVYEVRMVTRVSATVTLNVELTDRNGFKIYDTKTFTLSPANDWTVSEMEMSPSADDKEGCVRFTFKEKGEVSFGALSMMPKENFHGMRSDVVEQLKAIGPRLLRWPGGNFAGEYRWKDGLLPADQRGPLQAATEIETQPYTDGYDYHEINTDDFIALCREVGAEPMITINLAWCTPEESRQWVEYCNGSADSEYGKMRAERGHVEPYGVRFWSLGNEMGYGHMEGPKGPEGYAGLAEKHADEMLKVSPDIEFVSSGPYPNDNWATHSAARLSDKVKNISLHTYNGPATWSGANLHYTTPQGVKATYESVVKSADDVAKIAERMRHSLDATGKKLNISFDEWNQWFAWYRPSCVAEGIYTARVMHFFINCSNTLGIPFVCYFQPVGEGAILIDNEKSWLSANGQMFKLMKVHQDGKLCKVTENNDNAVAATIKDGVLTITLINAGYDNERVFDFPIKGKLIEGKLFTSDDVTPYSYFNETDLNVTEVKKHMKATLPPHSVGMMRIKLK
ncbi:MAG: hypothetical protein IJK49_03535 [Prevotella sp.]|nr:hypothetical protein [Prevotella sp.]